MRLIAGANDCRSSFVLSLAQYLRCRRRDWWEPPTEVWTDVSLPQFIWSPCCRSTSDDRDTPSPSSHAFQSGNRCVCVHVFKWQFYLKCMLMNYSNLSQARRSTTMAPECATPKGFPSWEHKCVWRWINEEGKKQHNQKALRIQHAFGCSRTLAASRAPRVELSAPSTKLGSVQIKFSFQSGGWTNSAADQVNKSIQICYQSFTFSGHTEHRMYLSQRRLDLDRITTNWADETCSKLKVTTNSQEAASTLPAAPYKVNRSELMRLIESCLKFITSCNISLRRFLLLL